MAKVSQLEKYMEFSRGKNLITHQTEAEAESEFFGLIEVITSHCFTHINGVYRLSHTPASFTAWQCLPPN